MIQIFFIKRKSFFLAAINSTITEDFLTSIALKNNTHLKKHTVDFWVIIKHDFTWLHYNNKVEKCEL